MTVQKLKETLNVSKTFVLRMDNLSLVLGEDDQVFTETERKVLVDMIIDTEVRTPLLPVKILNTIIIII